MKRYLSLLLAAFVFLSGCAVKDGGAPTVQQVEAKRDQLAELSSSKTVSIAEHPYLGAKPIVWQTDGEDIPVLNASVTLKQKGTLSEIAASLSTIAPLSAQVSDTDADDPQPTKQSSSPELPALDDLGLPPLASMSGLIDVSYTGSLRGLLDTISSLSGYGWDYDAKTNRMTFSAMQVRTYTIMAAPGVITYDSQVSNKSKERTGSSSISGSSINSTVTSGDTSSQTSQVHQTKIEMNIWKEIETAVKGLLSKRGT
ncbi:MAG: pilus assembly protein, partial [Bilophila wadsworthia]